jgi:hypothetical protein
MLHEWGAMIGAGAAVLATVVVTVGSLIKGAREDKGYGKPFNLDLTHLGQDSVAKGKMEVKRPYSMGENLIGAMERLLKGKGGNHLPRL